MALLSGWTSTALSVMVVIVAILIIGGLLVLAVIMYLRWKKFQQYRVLILEVDDDGLVQGFRWDKAGIFVESKTKHRRFFLKRSRFSLSADKVPVVYPRGKGKPMVSCVKLSNTDYRFLWLNNLRPQAVNLVVGEDDVNWAIETYERMQKLFDRSTLLQYMPFLMLAFVSIIILIIFIYFFKDFSVLKEVAVELGKAAQAMAQARAGTVVVPT